MSCNDGQTVVVANNGTTVTVVETKEIVVDNPEHTVVVDCGETIIEVSSHTQTVNVNTIETIVDIPSQGLDILTIGTQGPAADVPFVIVPFAFNTASPLTLIGMVSGQFILETELEIDVAFDDVLATLSIGTPADNEKLLANVDNDPMRLSNYGTNQNVEFIMNETVNLYISPGSSTQGSGRVTLTKKTA